MNIFLSDAESSISKNFQLMYSKKHRLITSPTDLSDLASVCAFFRQNAFDAVIFTGASERSRFDESAPSKELICFRNVQYAAILSGVKKIIVCGDAADLEGKQKNAVAESSFDSAVPSDNYGLTRYLITLLASKDKISTTLRFFNPYGLFIKKQDSALMTLFASSLVGKKDVTFAGDAAISSIFLADAAKIIQAFVISDFPKGDYNVASDNPVTLSEASKIIKKLGKSCGRELSFNFLNRERSENICDTQKLKIVLPSFKFTSASAALGQCYEYYAKHKTQLK